MLNENMPLDPRNRRGKRVFTPFISKGNARVECSQDSLLYNGLNAHKGKLNTTVNGLAETMHMVASD
jgi:hypothetical protein